MEEFYKYLIIINVLSFLLCVINLLLKKIFKLVKTDKLIYMLTMAGGSIGIFLFILFFDRKSVKENMMSRVFLICVMIMQIIILLFMNGVQKEHLTFDFVSFYLENKIFIAYSVLINIVTFIVYAIDKINAIKGKSRIRIVTLLGLAFIGGSVGAWIGMYTLRHKTRVDYFTVGIPLIMIMQVMVMFFVMNL